MLFNSIEFAIFFAAVVALYALLHRHWKLRKAFLLGCSCLFYMAWNPPYVLLLVFSTFLDFTAGRQIARSEVARVRRSWLVLSLVGNLGVLAYFKYADFVLSAVWGVGPENAVYPEWVLQIVLPMGISFYTFQSLSYTIDVYRNRAALAPSFLDFALYVSFFPQLVAGPIIRSRDFLPQLETNHNATGNDVMLGVDQMFRGFAKKVLLADTLAVYVDLVYANPDHFGAVNVLLAIYAYAFQIYFDFSGYSDIAIGIARILGFRIPNNFQLPYLSQNPSEFWTRWHISLSSWLRDYLYISLGGSRLGLLYTYRNLFITMLLGGLWHGAAWNFVLWGAFHGAWLAVHRWGFRDRRTALFPRWLSILATFHLVCFGWVLFRAQDLDSIGAILGTVVNTTTEVYLLPVEVIFCIAAGFLSHGLGASERLKEWWQATFFGVRSLWYVFVVIAMFYVSKTSANFIYFQF